MQPLDGILVLDFTRLLPGAAATQALADAGAEVVKIEQPGEGDHARTLSPEVFAHTNAGKKSVALNLKHPLGRRAALDLSARAAVIVESFRPGVMARLGLDYGTLAAENPAVILASITGYGQSGEFAGYPGHDLNYMALSGALSLIADKDGAPVIPGFQIADLAGGAMQAVNRILLALIEARRTGRGAHLDISMTAGLRPLLVLPLAVEAASSAPAPSAGMLTGRYACYHVYRARNGTWVAVGALEAKFWHQLCACLGLEDLAAVQFDDSRQAEAKARLQAIFQEKEAEHWFAELGPAGCCVTPVRGLTAGGDFPVPQAPPPALGQDTAEVLKRAGYTDGQIERMLACGAAA